MADFPCYPPSQLQAEWNGSVVTLTWGGTALSFSIRYRYKTEAWSYLPNSLGNSTTVPGLIPGRVYQFEVTSNCPAEPTVPQTVMFHIPSGLSGPTGLGMIQKTATTATIEWDGPGGVYVVVWKDAETLEEFHELVDANTYTIVDMIPGRNYKITVARLYQDESIPPVGIQYLDKDLCCS